MYLKSLELQGFKSFADKTVLNFGSDITAIVGPNGSGKSNISDAIRWVMGEQSTRALRGAKMEDVIFGGTQKRAQLGFAEASLTLDNSDGSFPIDSGEIMVTRRYYRSGESEYFINKQSARLRDVNELFMDTGLGREGYSNISQGRIDEILSLKSTDRREIFEEASGISKFRHRKEETERKLATAEDNLLRIGDKISELELQVEPLREQAEKAKKYLGFREELKGIEIAVWMDALDRFSESKKKAEDDYRSASFILSQEHDNLESLYRKAEFLSETLHDFDLKMDQKRVEISDADGAVQHLDGEIHVLQASLQNNEENILRVRAELSEQDGRRNTVDKQIKDSEARISEIIGELAKLEAELRDLLEQSQKLAQSSEGSTRSYLLLQGKIGEARVSLAQSNAEAEAASEKERQEKERCGAVMEELREAEQRHLTLEQEKTSCAASLREAKENAAAFKNMLDGFRLRLQSRDGRKAELQEACNRLHIEIETASSRIRLLEEMEKEYEGFSKSVRSVMQESERGNLRNIHGPVSRLLRTDEEYAIAIETALGAAMQNIVVSTENDAKAAIQMLARRDIGRATFLPLNVTKGRRLSEPGIEAVPGFIGIASDLVTAEKQYSDVILNLLGRTVIAEDLDYAIPMARRFSHRFRIVTLDGQVINAGGSMTGGSVSRNSGFLSRANELQKLKAQLSKKETEYAEKKEVLSEATREAEKVRYEIDVVSGQLRESEDEVLRKESALSNYEVLLKTLDEVIRSDRRELENVRESEQKAHEAVLTALARTSLYEQQTSSMEAELNALALDRSGLDSELQSISDQTATLKMKQAALAAEETSVRENVGRLNLLLSQMQGDRRQKESLIGQYEADNQLLNERIRTMADNKLEKEGIAAKKRGELSELSRQRLSSEAEKTVTERSAQDKSKEILNLERECARLEQKKASAELEEKQLIDKLWETYGLTRSTAAPACAKLESIAQGQRRITELKRKISALGTPNLGAIEEFERVNDRYQYLTEQRNDVMTSKKDLEDIIRAITKEMTSIFVTEFAKINGFFGSTFTEMFGGGSAALLLEDPEHPLDCGIDIRVQPPGKQVKTITLLSGGEKAFVAIALYFAILKVRPAPFCMLDEIDAALDDRNVERFASYLRTLSKMTQFIVVTHRRGTMEEADVLYGVTMQEQGVSKMLYLDMNQMTEELGITE